MNVRKIHSRKKKPQSNRLRLALLFSIITVFSVSVYMTRSQYKHVQQWIMSTNDIKHNQNNNHNPKPNSCYPKKGIRPLKNRDEIGDLLQEHKMEIGVEVGVKQGDFAQIILSKWKSCKSYKLVDLWAKQENYKDVANVRNEVHEQFMQETKDKLEQYNNITEYYRMYSVEAAKKMRSESIDFVYIDARHDYCGVMEDLEAYWPLVRPGGIIAGHDYNSNDEIRGQDWSLCMDGTVNPQAVKGAVNEFFLSKGLTISVTYYREHNFMSWIVQKPLC